jgi:GT2 family glycosyltransferase
LAATLHCLEGQTLQADELVIAADGPLPEPLQAVIRQCSLPWHLHQQQRNRGIGATLAAVAPRCRGEFIVRIDSDDLYAPGHTAAVVGALQANPQLGAVGCQLLELDTDQGGQVSARATPTDTQTAKRWLPWRNPLNHQTVALRRRSLMDAGGYRHMPAFEDWDLWWRIAAAGYGLLSLPSCTAAARVNHQHRQRRRGWGYMVREFRFYGYQIRERRLGTMVAVGACLSRLPWRVLPAAALRWWMQSRLRGSPALDATWITELLEQTPGQTSSRQKQEGKREQ